MYSHTCIVIYLIPKTLLEYSPFQSSSRTLDSIILEDMSKWLLVQTLVCRTLRYNYKMQVRWIYLIISMIKFVISVRRTLDRVIETNISGVRRQFQKGQYRQEKILEGSIVSRPFSKVILVSKAPGTTNNSANGWISGVVSDIIRPWSLSHSGNQVLLAGEQ